MVSRDGMDDVVWTTVAATSLQSVDGQRDAVILKDDVAGYRSGVAAYSDHLARMFVTSLSGKRDGSNALFVGAARQHHCTSPARSLRLCVVIVTRDDMA